MAATPEERAAADQAKAFVEQAISILEDLDYPEWGGVVDRLSDAADEMAELQATDA